MPRRYYSSTAARTTLSSGINSTATSITVGSVSGFPGSFPYTLILDQDTASEEVVTVTAASGTTLTVTRGQDGTTGVSHSSGAAVNHGVSARDFDEPNSHVNDTTTDVHSQYVLKSLVQNTKGAVPVGTGSTVAALSPGSNGQTLVADSSQTNGLRYVDGQTQKNGLVNGSFSVWQRGTSAAIGSGTFQADRWQAARVGFAAGATQSRQTASLDGFQYCARVQRDSGNTGTASIILGQNLETVSCYQYQGKVVTLSFWARKGANFSASSDVLVSGIYTGTGTDQNLVTSGTLTGVASTTQNNTLTSSWQRFTVSHTVASSATQVCVQFYYTPAGTAGANDWFEITGVQLEASPVATPFEFEPYETTLRKCQRYYWRETSTAGAQGSTLGGNIGAAVTTTVVDVNVPFPTRMRTGPSAIEVANLAAYGWRSTSFYSTGTWTIAFGSDRSATLRYTHGTGVFTINDVVSVMSNASGAYYIAFSAEL